MTRESPAGLASSNCNWPDFHFRDITSNPDSKLFLGLVSWLAMLFTKDECAITDILLAACFLSKTGRRGIMYIAGRRRSLNHSLQKVASPQVFVR